MAKDQSAHIGGSLTHKFGKDEYILSKITLKDLKTLECELASLAIEGVKGNLEGLPTNLQEHLLNKAYEESLKRRIGTREFNSAATSVTGLGIILWLSLRKEHPKVTKDQAIEMITDNDAELIKKIHTVAGWKEADEESFTKAQK